MPWNLACRRTPIGVDVGARSLKAMQIEQTPQGPRLVAAAVVPRLEGQSGAPGADELTALGALLARAGFEGTRLVLAAPSSALLHSMPELPPRSSNAPIEQLARLELARTHKCAPDSFEMGCWDLPAPARSAKSTQVMAFALPHAPADALLEPFEACGLEVQAIDVAPAALARACAPLAAEHGITAMLDLGWNAGVLLLLYKGAIIYARSLPESGTARLHQQFTERLAMEPDIADYLLREVGLRDDRAHVASEAILPETDLPDDGRALLVAHVEATAHELSISFSYAVHQYPEATVASLLLVGGGAAIPGLAARLQALLRISTTTVSPAQAAQCDPRLLPVCSSPQLMLAAGLAQFPLETGRTPSPKAKEVHA